MSQNCSGMEKCTFSKVHSSNEGITYHDVKSLSNHLGEAGEAVCRIKKYQKVTNKFEYRKGWNSWCYWFHCSYFLQPSKIWENDCTKWLGNCEQNGKEKKFKDTRRTPPDKSALKMMVDKTESTKLRALRTHVPTCYVLTYHRVFRAYVLTYQRVLCAYVLMCQLA